MSHQANFHCIEFFRGIEFFGVSGFSDIEFFGASSFTGPRIFRRIEFFGVYFGVIEFFGISSFSVSTCIFSPCNSYLRFRFVKRVVMHCPIAIAKYPYQFGKCEFATSPWRFRWHSWRFEISCRASWNWLCWNFKNYHFLTRRNFKNCFNCDFGRCWKSSDGRSRTVRSLSKEGFILDGST